MSQTLAHSTRSRRPIEFVAGGVAAAVLGIIGWIGYFLYAVVREGTCLFGDGGTSGWGDYSFGVVTLLGLGLWVADGVLAFRNPARIVQYILWFTVIWVVSLAIVGLVSPLLWDPPQCGEWDIHW